MDKKGVLQIVDCFDAVNGVNITVKEIYQSWSPTLQFSFHIIGSGRRSIYEDNTYKSIKILKSMPLPSFIYPNLSLGFGVRTILKTIRNRNIACVHIATPGTLGFTASFLARINNIPIVCTHHTNWDIYNLSTFPKVLSLPLNYIIKIILKILYKSSQKVIVHSPNVIKKIKNLGVKSVEYLPLGVNIYSGKSDIIEAKKKAKKIICDKYHFSKEKPLIMYVGRISKDKNINLLKSIIDNNKDINFLVIGEGPLTKYLSQAKNCVITGVMDRSDLDSCYLSGDCFFSGSIMETVGRVFLESLGYGTPLIIPASGDHVTILKRCPSVFFFVEKSVSDIVIKMKEIINSGKYFEYLQLEAYRFAQEFTWKKVLKRHVDVYKEYENSLNISKK